MAEPSGNRQSQVLTVLAFAAGVVVGMNWPKIKKRIGPLIAAVSGTAAEGYAGIAKFFADNKEKVEDAFAATKVRKVNPRARKSTGLKV